MRAGRAIGLFKALCLGASNMMRVSFINQTKLTGHAGNTMGGVDVQKIKDQVVQDFEQIEAVRSSTQES